MRRRRQQPPASGHAKLRLSASKEVLRQASSGPTPVRSSRKSAIGTFTLLKNGGADADFAARHPFGKYRKQRSPENREARGEKDQIVEQEARFARDERIELIIAAQIIAILPVRGEADHENNDQEADEPAANGRFRKRMHGTDDAGAREHRPENAQHESDEHQPDVPDLHHAALFLHHHGVQEKRCR